MLSVVVILLGTAALAGIAYTYTHRSSALIDAASHLLIVANFRRTYKFEMQVS